MSRSHGLVLVCGPQLADTDENQGSLGFEEFCSFYKMISTRRDLYLIMISYSNQKEFMDLNDLARFLEIEQKVYSTARKHCNVPASVIVFRSFNRLQIPHDISKRYFFFEDCGRHQRAPCGDSEPF